MEKAKVKVVRFEEIWKNYPEDPPCVGKDGRPPKGWDNQCAMRVGIALERSGVSFKTFPGGGRCPVGPLDGGMIGSAQRLADWLRSHPFPGATRPRRVPPATWEKELNNKTGIVFFKNYWRRRGETKGVGSGDHIDLWNKDRLSPGLASFLRFSLGISSVPNLNPFTRAEDNQNFYSDLSKSEEIWFWDVK